MPFTMNAVVLGKQSLPRVVEVIYTEHKRDGSSLRHTLHNSTAVKPSYAARLTRGSVSVRSAFICRRAGSSSSSSVVSSVHTRRSAQSVGRRSAAVRFIAPRLRSVSVSVNTKKTTYNNSCASRRALRVNIAAVVDGRRVADTRVQHTRARVCPCLPVCL